LPAREALHDRVELPEPPVILVEDREQIKLVEFVVTAKVTVPVKLFNGATDIVEVPLAPELTETMVGLAVTLKSGAAVT
jgi:hypothetical protein